MSSTGKIQLCLSDCFDKLSSQYKFYLAFENALCPDYVTEKFFRSLKLPVVPIVMGGDNYRSLVPKETGFIDVNDFKSVRALTDYLKYLDSNDEAYEAFFNWRREYDIYERWPLCILCEKLHDPSETWQSYENAYAWWYLDGNGQYLCEEGYERHYFHSQDDILVDEVQKNMIKAKNSTAPTAPTMSSNLDLGLIEYGLE